MRNKKEIKLLLLFGILFILVVGNYFNFGLFQVKNESSFENDTDNGLKSSYYDWEEQIRIPVGEQPYGISVEDVNNDGFNDIVTANFYGNNISILLWNSTINYWNPDITLSVGIYPTCLFVGDANNDGSNDIVVGNQDSNSVSIFTWNSTLGDWDDEVMKSVGSAPLGIIIGDANNDGYNDIVAANYNSDDTSILLWNITSNDWDTQRRISVGSGWVGPISVFVGDANNDGYNDIVVGNHRNLVVAIILWNETSVNWNTPIYKTLPVQLFDIFIADADHDGYNDIVIANRANGNPALLLWNETASDWSYYTFSSSLLGCFSVYVGDANNDGYDDLVNIGFIIGGSVASILLWNKSINSWNPEILKPIGDRGESIFVGDANNDGNNDIVTSNADSDDVSILIYKPPILHIDVIDQTFTLEQFNITFFLYIDNHIPIDYLNFRIWWDGINVSDSISDLGDGFYQVVLEPVFMEPDEDPVLLNMTLYGIGFDDTYHEIYIEVEPPVVLETLNIIIPHQSFSIYEFNFTFYVFNELGNPIDFATFEIWWNEIEISNSMQNLGGGLYFITLDPITVYPWEDPILLNMTVSALWYDDLYFETYIAVDPESLTTKGPFPPITPSWVILINLLLVIGTPAVVTAIIIYSLKKRREIP